MRVLGTITEITLSYQQEKTDKDGRTFYGERYTIFIECGDDVFMTESEWLHCQSKGGGLMILNRRGIIEGAQGNALIRFGFRDYNGKRYHEITLEKFDMLAMKINPAPAPEGSIAHIEDKKADIPLMGDGIRVEVTQEPAAEAVQAEEGKETDLPF